MNEFITNRGGSYRPILGKQPYRFLGKNPLPPSRISKRRVSGGGGVCGGGKMGGMIGNGGSKNFSINFIGSGFCDG